MATSTTTAKKTADEVRADAVKLIMESGSKPVLVQSTVELSKATANNFIMKGEDMVAAYFTKDAFNGNAPKKGQRFGLVIFRLNSK